MNMLTISFSAYPDILLWGSRGMLAVLLGAMPWAALSQVASPPSQWAGLMHMGAMAVFAILACTGFVSLRGRVGSVLYKQERLGQNGRKFDLYKFRTMVPDAEARLEALQHANECDGPAFKIKNDPRIIPYIKKRGQACVIVVIGG